MQKNWEPWVGGLWQGQEKVVAFPRSRSQWPARQVLDTKCPPQEKWQESKSVGGTELLPVHHQAPPRVSIGKVQVRPQEGGPEVQPVQPLLFFSHLAKSQQELARRGVTEWS